MGGSKLPVLVPSLEIPIHRHHHHHHHHHHHLLFSSSSSSWWWRSIRITGPRHQANGNALRSSSSLRFSRPPIILSCLPPPPPPSFDKAASTKLFVTGLSFRTTEESLRNAFQKFGELVHVNLVMDRIANRPRGFAFLHYSSDEESKKAIEEMHGKFLDGRVIFVEFAKSKSELREDLKGRPQTQY